MGTARAMRYFRPDPVPQEIIDKVLWAATRASSPGNRQSWDFVVVRSVEQRARIAKALAPRAAVSALIPVPTDPVQRRLLIGSRNLWARLGDVPVLIFVCGANRFPPDAPEERYMWSAVHSAGQNLVVAARALGVGAAFTTIHVFAESAIRSILAMPDDQHIGLTIPLGWPDRPFGPMARRPVEEVVHYDRW